MKTPWLKLSPRLAPQTEPALRFTATPQDNKGQSLTHSSSFQSHVLKLFVML